MRPIKFALFVLVSLAICSLAQSRPTAMLTASDAATNFGFLGGSVAISGSTVAGGAPGTTVDGHGSQGAVDVFTKAASVPWSDITESARLIDPNGDSFEGLGATVAMSGDGSVIAARTAPGGAIFVFLRPDAGWSGMVFPSAILALGPPPRPWVDQGHFSGVAINSKGTTIVAGAPDYGYKEHRKGGQDVPSSVSRGAVYVWSEPEGGWATATKGGMSQTATLIPPDAGTGQAFGTSVGIAADTIVAGAINPAGPGAAYIFQRPAKGVWVDSSRFASKLTASDGETGDQFGLSVAAGESGALVAVGTQRGCFELGQSYVFVRPTNRSWPTAITQTAELTPSDVGGNCFGTAVAVANDLVIVGAPLAGPQVLGGIPSGADYSFAEPETGWTDMSLPVSMVGSSEFGEFGFSNSVGGRSTAVGAPYTTVGGNAGTGAVYIFSQ